MKSILVPILARVARRHAAWALTFACLLPAAASAQVLDVSNTPLYGGRQPHPNVVVATSVEYPTVGSAYLNDQSGNAIQYLRTNTYLGYFNPGQCYAYTGSTTTGYFYPSGATDSNFECKGGSNATTFSGNFMNWATMSAIDEFRYAMTGGNRIDENSRNGGVLIERAYLPDGNVQTVPSFYALRSNFPRRYITANGNGTVCVERNSGADTCWTGGSKAPDVLGIASSYNSQQVNITSCKALMFLGTNGGGNCSTPDANVGTYHIAVVVCDSTEGPTRTDLCLQYGGASGKYKPVGQAQINAASMRFAAFGYLMDRNVTGYTVPTNLNGTANCDNGTGWNTCRYGGVLRSPMKYLGPTKYDANLAASTNTNSEINADGTLTTDPEGTASSAGGTYSGFINYINRFGSTGVYKVYDPAGEMFYEAVRYYQGLQPTDLAISGNPNNAIKDYFPITTTWTDPIQSICASNYIINLSDANTWNDTYIPGFNNNPGVPVGPGRPSSRAVDTGLDANLWTTRIGTLESTMSSLTTNDVRPNLSGLQNQLTGGTGTSSQLVSGIAFWANTNDIRSDLTGIQTIKTISVDVAEGSTTVYDRSLYLMGKYGGFKNTIDRTTDTYANPFWGTNPANPQGPAIRTNSEWQDSTGFPANYLLASDPTKLINGLRAAFASINTQTGTLSGAALTSANLTFGAAGAYVATFNPSKWSGSVLLDSLSVDGSGNLVVSSSPVWDAGALLTARCGTVASGSTVCTDLSTDVNKRNIFTTIKVLGTRTASAFSLAGITLDLNYLGALNTNPATGVADALAGARINYLRGYRGDEASSLNFRIRDSAMGDIVNSGPVYVGAPAAGIPDADFQTFYLNNASRTAAVYAGANDGMLHALRASDGFELFAYIPGYSYPDLNDLTYPGYTHQTYVDTVPKVQDVKLNGTWKSVLVGASGNGVQGIFGLDVTDPTAFGTTKVLFEFSDADDADFGSPLAPVEIAKLWVSGTAAAPVFRYFAVVTGYNKNRTTVNNRTDSSVSADTTNKGVLFLIALDHTLGSAWVQNTDYYKFTFPASNTSLANGLGPVSLLLSKSGDLSTVAMYFGDLQGNFWRFNTASGTPTTWAPALGTTTAPLPIFVAQDASGNRQPITARPELAGGPFGSTLIYFGTGKYFGQSDLTLPATTTQSEYALLDVNPSVLITRSTDLVQRTATISGSNVNVTGSNFSYSGPSAKKGWYLDFPSSLAVGERSVTKPAVRTGLLTFTTLTLSNDVCSPGNGYIYQVNALTGLPLTGAGTAGAYASTVGIPGPPRVVDLTTNAGQTQATGEVINKKTQVTLVSGTASKIAGYGATDSNGNNIQVAMPPTQQINWREITNWNDKTGH